MKPFRYIEDAEVWIELNAKGSICVLVKSPEWSDPNRPPSRWTLEWGILSIDEEGHGRLTPKTSL